MKKSSSSGRVTREQIVSRVRELVDCGVLMLAQQDPVHSTCWAGPRMREFANLDSADIYRVAIKIESDPDNDGYPVVYVTGRGLLNPSRAARADRAACAVALHLWKGGNVPITSSERRRAVPWALPKE